MTYAQVGAEVTTLAEARRQFLLRRSPRWLLTGIAAIAALRLALGTPTWRDAAAVAAIALVYPFGEWAIHVYLLHLPPVRIRGRLAELPTARAHRLHHENPFLLDGVLLAPAEAVALLALALPLVIGGIGAAAGIVTGMPPLAALVSAWLAGALLVLTYEWCHFVIHTAHQPRSRYYRSIWRTHRLHHFKNEHYWHGITSTVADHAFGTSPDQRTIERSGTARTLQAR